MPSIQISPEEIKPIKLNLPSNEEEWQERKKQIRKMDELVEEINQKLKNYDIHKLLVSEERKRNLEFIENHIIEIVELKENPEIRITDESGLLDRLVNLETSLACLDKINKGNIRANTKDSFEEGVKAFKKYILKLIKGQDEDFTKSELETRGSLDTYRH